MMKVTNTNTCNNCGKHGHSFHNCKLPIISYGIILCHFSSSGIQFLMIRRKDSFGYIDFIRGKYSLYNIYQLQNIINEMSVFEKEQIITKTFKDLWYNMWGGNANLQYKNEEQLSCKKFEQLKTGIIIDNKKITLEDIVNQSTTNWLETEWEFPKGRSNYKESDLNCALREFTEETGISLKKIKVVENVFPFEETFIGTNYKSYKHKYFLACMNEAKECVSLMDFQPSEVSKLEWKTIEECLESMRSYNLEKKELITNVYKLLKEYRLFS